VGYHQIGVEGEEQNRGGRLTHLPLGDLFIPVSPSLERREHIHVMFSAPQTHLNCLESNPWGQLIMGAFKFLDA